MNEFAIQNATTILVRGDRIEATKFDKIYEWCYNSENYDITGFIVWCATPEDLTAFLLKWS